MPFHPTPTPINTFTRHVHLQILLALVFSEVIHESMANSFYGTHL